MADRLLNMLPNVILLTIISIFVTHVTKTILEFVSKKQHPHAIIGILELILIVVLMFFAFHAHFAEYLFSTTQGVKEGEHSGSMEMLYLLVGSTFLSIILYALHVRFSPPD